MENRRAASSQPRLEKDSFHWVWGINAVRRHLEAGQRAMIKEKQLAKSEAWRTEQARLKQEADEARSEVAKKRPRKKDGTLATSRASREARLDSVKPAKKRRSSAAAAKEANVSHATMERAQYVNRADPELGDQVEVELRGSQDGRRLGTGEVSRSSCSVHLSG